MNTVNRSRVRLLRQQPDRGNKKAGHSGMSGRRSAQIASIDGYISGSGFIPQQLQK